MKGVFVLSAKNNWIKDSSASILLSFFWPLKTKKVYEDEFISNQFSTARVPYSRIRTLGSSEHERLHAEPI
jgi:hypothetical protein